MKAFYSTIVIMSMMSSCSRNSSTNNVTAPPSSFTVTANGRTHTINGSLASSSSTGSIIYKHVITGTSGSVTTTYTAYTLKATDQTINSTDPNYLYFEIPVSPQKASIAAGYSSNQATGGDGYYKFFGANAGGTTYDDNMNNDTWTLNVTSVNDGYASGTFTGTIVDSRNNRSFIITSGKFTSVKIID
ncbi:hypothetical protein [Flaviaesturariibacter amylovorans]|uniref:Uncharacterized protein n=1 Tax=Flaviaesturariibacter amylovorans TaxID=1084520 RepID=A0ABP8H760_9BACT